MRISREAMPYAAGAVTAGLLLAGCSGNGEQSGATPTPTPSTAAEYCAQGTYTLGEYKTNVGPNLVAALGQVGSNGQFEFASDNANDTAKIAAAKIAPNNAALSVVYTIINAESGVTPSKVLNESSDTFAKMQKDVSYRGDVCEAVVGRILTTPNQREYQSPTGMIVEYAPEYTANELSGLSGDSTTNTAAVEVFGIAPVANSANEARDNAISQSWGITAAGKVIQTSNKLGNAQVALSGETVHPEPTASASAPAGVTPSPEANGNNGGNNGQGGGVTNGNTPENQPGPNTSGPSGPNPEASSSASETTPSGGDTSGTPTPTPTRTSSTPTPTPTRPTPTPTRPTPTPTPTRPTPTPTPTPTTTPTPTPTKSGHPCDPNTGEIC